MAAAGATTKDSIGCGIVDTDGDDRVTAIVLSVLTRAVATTGAGFATGATATPWTRETRLAPAVFDEDTDTPWVAVGTEMDPLGGFLLCFFGVGECLRLSPVAVEDCAEITTPAPRSVVDDVPEAAPPPDVDPASASPSEKPVDGDGELASVFCCATTAELPRVA